MFLLRNVLCLLGICYLTLSLENCTGIIKYLDGSKSSNEVNEICLNRPSEFYQVY